MFWQKSICEREKKFQTENINIWMYQLKNSSKLCKSLIQFQPSLVDEIRIKERQWTKSKRKTSLNNDYTCIHENYMTDGGL